MTRVEEFHRKWSKNSDYRKAYDELEEEYALIGALIDAQTAAGETRGSGR
jgi:hypothetical protein